MAGVSVIRELDALKDLAASGGSLANTVIQGLDLRDAGIDWSTLDVTNSYFLGCRFGDAAAEELVRSRGARIFPLFPGLPYDPYRRDLYTPAELATGYERGGALTTLDWAIYERFRRTGGTTPNILEALAERIHDYSIDDALLHLVGADAETRLGRRIVGIMGGHAARRDEPDYERAARLGWLLGRHGYLVVSGGGSGIMEAANLGAYMSPFDEGALASALMSLARTPSYDPADRDYFDAAFEVRARWPAGGESLAVPTWYHGCDTNLFPTRIAKYFSNNIREDGLLTIAQHGVIFTRGSAGTTREVFMNAEQNHYALQGYVAPMVFLGRSWYGREVPIYETLRQLARGRPYEALLALCDDPEEVVDFLEAHPPARVSHVSAEPT